MWPPVLLTFSQRLPRPRVPRKPAGRWRCRATTIARQTLLLQRRRRLHAGSGSSLLPLGHHDSMLLLLLQLLLHLERVLHHACWSFRDYLHLLWARPIAIPSSSSRTPLQGQLLLHVGLLLGLHREGMRLGLAIPDLLLLLVVRRRRLGAEEAEFGLAPEGGDARERDLDLQVGDWVFGDVVHILDIFHPRKVSFSAPRAQRASQLRTLFFKKCSLLHGKTFVWRRTVMIERPLSNHHHPI